MTTKGPRDRTGPSRSLKNYDGDDYEAAPGWAGPLQEPEKAAITSTQGGGKRCAAEDQRH